MTSAAPPAPGPERMAWLRLVALEQRALLVCILVYLLLLMLAYVAVRNGAALGLARVLAIVFTLAVCVSVFFGAKLASRVFGVPGAVICGLVLISPTVVSMIGRRDLAGLLGSASLITLLLINGRATRALRSAGIRVGFLGVNPRDLR